MKKTFWTLFILSALISLFYNPIYSQGLGIFVPISSGSTHYGIEQFDMGSQGLELNQAIKWDNSNTSYGLGFVFDSRLAENRLFNYRLQVGFHYSSGSYGTSLKDNYAQDGYFFPGYPVDLYQLNFDNSFGFGIIRTSLIRFWVGPQVRIGIGYGKGQKNILNENLKIDLLRYAIGFAPVLGLNFNIDRNITLSTDFGYRYSIYFGVSDYEYYSYSTSYGINTNTEAHPITGYDSQFFINFALIIRFNDMFDSPARRNRKY